MAKVQRDQEEQAAEMEAVAQIGRRFHQFLTRQNISQTEAAQKLNTQVSQISRLFDKVNFQADLLARINLAYPALRYEWLLTGEGPMIAETGSASMERFYYGETARELNEELDRLEANLPNATVETRSQIVDRVAEILREQVDDHNLINLRIIELQTQFIRLWKNQG